MSDSSSDEETVGSVKEYFLDGVIQPYRFEPECSDSDQEKEVSKSSGSDFDDSEQWCFCLNCNDSDIKEKICCTNPKTFDNDIFDGKDCITTTEAFASVCLNMHVLQASIGAWNYNNEDIKELENKNLRFIAYKQYIYWSYGYLGKKRRKPLPICVIDKIRETFPDPNNVYVPYEDIA